MTTSRRDFLKTTAAAGGTLALGLGAGASLARAQDRTPGAASLLPADEGRALASNPREAGPSSSASLRILILGGTSLLGPHQVHEALARGHRVTIFTRGRTEPTVNVADFERVEHLTGDRAVPDYASLEGREWDVVLDNSTSQWEWARDAAQLLRDRVGLYAFVSSTGVYWPYLTPYIDESVQPRTTVDPEDEGGSGAYGVMKTLGEMAVQEALGDRALVVRPQHFTGPGERSDRYGYWVERMERGGEVLAMGKPTDPIMLLDVRDLAEFMLDLAESRTSGVFNVAGPASPLTMEEFLHGLRFCTGAPVTWTWVDDYDFLRDQGLSYAIPWVMPVGLELGHTSIDISKALAHGLRHRPLAQTHFAFREWWYSPAVPQERRRDARFPLNPEREAQILEAWKGR
jgi:2'-hydroxyisoflavone reductase